MMRTFKLKYCFDNEGIKEIDNPTFIQIEKVIDSFDFTKWCFASLLPSEPINDSIYLQVGTCNEKDEKDKNGKRIKFFNIETRFVKSDDFSQYSYITSDEKLVKSVFKNYFIANIVPNIGGWEDITEKLKEENKPTIIEYIQDNIQADGTLPENFNINQKFGKCKHETGLRFADGFLDGGLMYHCSADELDTKPLYEIVKLISKGEYNDAEIGLNNYFFDETQVRTLAVIDDVQQWILDNGDSLDINNLVHFALQEILMSKNIEVIKFSLTICELFDLSGWKECADAIEKLALSDEFTLFCGFAVRGWPNKNDLIFSMAKKVRGWGRVFAITELEPTSDAIKKWLLEEGCDDDIMAEYSALEVAKKIDINSLVKKDNLTQDEYKQIGNVIENLIPEGPCPGISELKDKEVVLADYLHHAKMQTNDISDYGRVLFILEYTKGLDNKLAQKQLQKLCQEILETEQCKKVVQTAMKHGNGFGLAEYLGMDRYHCAVKCIEKNPLKNIGLLEIALTDDLEKNKELMGLYEKALPLDKIATGPENSLGFGRKLTTEYMDLSMVLQYLSNHVGLGEELIICALNSPSMQNRSAAIRVLKAWLGTGAKLSPALQQAIEMLRKTEVDAEIRENIEKLMV